MSRETDPWRNVESPRNQAKEWASENWRHSHLSEPAVQSPAPRRAIFCLGGSQHSCPYSKPHPALGLVPRFLNSTKRSSFQDVRFLTVMKPLTSRHFSLQVVLLYASTYVLVSLSIDRYHAIVYPMKFLQGGEQAQPSTILGWGVLLILSS